MRNFSVIKERILQYLDYKGISKYKMYQETGITNGILSQTNGMNEDNILRFLSVYKDISLKFLFYGEGDILNTNDIINESVTNQDKNLERIIDSQKCTISQQVDQIECLKSHIRDLQTIIKQ